MLHRDHDIAGRSHEVHGPSHAFDHFAGNFPIGYIAVLRNFHGPQDRKVHFAGAYHPKAHSRIKERRTRQSGNGLLTSIDEIRILRTLPREWPHAQQTVFRLQLDFHSLGNKIGDKSWDTNAEIDIVPVF